MKIKKPSKKAILITASAIVVAGIVVGAYFAYRAYAGDIAYMLYAQRAKSFENFESRKVYLRDSFRAIARDSKDAQNYVELGATQYGMKDYAEAEKNYLKALDRAPNASVVFWNLSHLYMETKEYDKAEKYAKLAIERLPDKSLGYQSLGELYTFYIPEKKSELAQLYETAYKETRDSIFLLLIGGHFRDYGQMQKAIDSYNTWIAVNPSDPNKAAIEMEIKQLEERL